MHTHQYHPNEKCTASVAAELIYRSADTGKRWLHKLRKSKGYKKRFPISVGEFCDFYHIQI